MKRQVRRSFRIVGRKLSQVRSAASDIFRSNSYHPSVRISTVSPPSSSDSEDDDAVFEALPLEGSSENGDRGESVVLIPCEFCHLPHPSECLTTHQLSCEQNPNRRRRTRVNLTNRARNYGRAVSDSGATTIPSAPPHSPSHTRSPSPTEGFPVPADLQCPITGVLFCDPVVGSDGHTYERAAIAQWLVKDGKSPITRDKLSPGSLHPNRIVKKQVDDFRAECQRKKLLYPYKIDVDLKKTEQLPYITTKNKSIYRAEWIKSSNHSNINLVHLTGDSAEKLAEMICRLGLHRNIVRVFGRVEHNDKGILLVQEETPTKTLSQLITNTDPKLSLQILDIIIYQIVSALQHLTDAGVTHRHITADNVLIYNLDDTSENTLIKLTIIEETDNIDISYTAPEVTTNNLYSEKSDVYALGKLALEMYSLELTTDNDEESSERQDLFERCIETDPNDRPTFDGLIIEINHLINRENSAERFL